MKRIEKIGDVVVRTITLPIRIVLASTIRLKMEETLLVTL